MDTKLTSLFLFLLLLLLPSSTDASDPNKPTHPHHGSVHPSRGLVITVMLTLGLLLIAFFTLYFQRCRGQNLYSSRFPPAGPHANRGVAGAKPGLDRAVIDSFPTLVYSEARELSHHDHHRPVECAVCLSEFGDREKLRLLPGCKHAFHLDCIDMWLDSHTTCPVCRSQLDVGSPATAESTAAATTEVAVDVAGTWTEGERERFTLRVEPEVLSGCGSMGRGEGSSEGVHGVARWVGKTLSERWACRARTAPFDGSRGGGGGGTSGGPSTSATDASIV